MQFTGLLGSFVRELLLASTLPVRMGQVMKGFKNPVDDTGDKGPVLVQVRGVPWCSQGHHLGLCC